MFDRRFAGIGGMRRGVRGSILESAPAASPDFLATYSANPITLDGTAGTVETVDGVDVNRRLWVNGFRVEYTDEVGNAGSRIFEIDGSNYLGKLGEITTKSMRLRAGGTNFAFAFVAADYTVSDRLYIEVDWYNKQIRFGKTDGAGTDTPDTNSPVTIGGNQWWRPGVAKTVTIGATASSTLPWTGDIYQPTGLRAADMVGGLTVITLAGQSNPAGATGDTPTDASQFDPYPGCRYFHKIDGFVGASQYVMEDLDNLGTTSLWSVEVPLGRLMDVREDPDPVGIIRVAKGATYLNSAWLPTSRGGPGPQLVQWLDSLTEGWGAMQLDQQADVGVKVAVWWQGEADSGDLAAANAYQTNLTALIAEVRSHCGNPTLPFVIIYLRSTVGTYYATVQAAQDAVAAADPNVYIVDPGDPVTWVPFDGVHYQADAMVNHAAPALETVIYDTIGI